MASCFFILCPYDRRYRCKGHTKPPLRASSAHLRLSTCQHGRGTMSSSPFQYLIPELLSQVFIDCLSEDSESSFVNDTPLKLGRICSHWRQVALLTPSLWSRITVTQASDGLSQTTADLKSRYATIIQVFMSRSATSPVSIHVNNFDMPLITRELLLP